MTIKHLVLSGGGPIMIQILAAIQELDEHSYLNMSNIETIYSTSAGSIAAVILSLKFDWQTISDYIIKRPWHDVFQLTGQCLFDAYSKKGLYDYDTVKKCFQPLFNAKDIDLSISMKDFYTLTKIELNMFTFEINKYRLEQISYKTYPELPVLKALQMSCAVPVFIAPVFLNDQCFIDGGIACNYPLNFCIDSGKNPEEILGIRKKEEDGKEMIHEKSTLFDYILFFLLKSVFNVHNNYTQPTIKNELLCDAQFTLNTLKNTLSDIMVRRELFETGKCNAQKFLQHTS